ncbi:MAG: DUF4168 domain-containing protein [Desulfosudaceae bacterium]
MERCKSLTIMLVFVVMFLVGGFGPALAGNNPDDVYENEADKNTEMSAEEIKNEDIKAFVAAAKEIQEIRDDYAEKITGTEDADYNDLRKEAVKKMVETIEDQGIDEKTYRGIAYHAQKDKELLSRIY